MSTLSEHFVQDYYDLQEALVGAGLIVVTSGTKTDIPTVTGTANQVAPEGVVTVTVTDYDSAKLYWASSSGTVTASGSNSYIVTIPDSEGTYDLSVYANAAGEVLSDAGVWSIESVSGGNDAYTVLLLHMDGAHNGTTFTDDSASEHTITLAGNGSYVIRTSTTQKKFGTASCYQEIGDRYLQVPSSSDFNFGDGDFTIDCWVRVNDMGAQNTLCYRIGTPGSYNDRSFGINFYYNRLHFWWSTTTANDWDGSIVSSTTSLIADQWNHVAIIRSGSDILLATNGVIDNTTGSITGSIRSSSGYLWIVGFPWYGGYVDEFRISKGIARWTSDFDVPTIAYF